jgi:hypothetical protein
MTQVRISKRAEFSVFSVPLVAVEVTSGAVEIYRDDHGLEMFVGYVSDARVPAPVRMGAIVALCSKGAEKIRDPFRSC